MARYKCGHCSESYFGLGSFQEHVEANHDYEHLSAAVKDCESVDSPGVFELRGRTVVKCADCQTVYEAIGAKCVNCDSKKVLREDLDTCRCDEPILGEDPSRCLNCGRYTNDVVIRP